MSGLERGGSGQRRMWVSGPGGQVWRAGLVMGVWSGAGVVTSQDVGV